ncbi:hypothetical protein [Gilliamella sp. G0441]
MSKAEFKEFNMLDLKILSDEYTKAQNEVKDYLRNIDIEHFDYLKNKDILLKLIHSKLFEAKIFEVMLHFDKDEAINFLKTVYLEGNPRNKVSFSTNLDVMLDDYKEILGKDEYNKLIDSLSKSTKNFYPIKKAIEFVEDE